MPERQDDAHPELSRPPQTQQLHYHTAGSANLDELRERPRTASERSGGKPHAGPSRDMVYCIGAPMRSNGGSSHQTYGEKWVNVYYMYGDERRAIRTAIRANEEYIDGAFGSDATASIFAQGWPDQLYQLLCEEWEFYRRTGELHIDTDHP